MLKIGLFGPLQVFDGEHLVTPSAPKVRQVLTLLALRGNRTVPQRQLIEEVWGESPPRSASTTLQTYIHHLRKLPGLASDGRTGAEGAVSALRTVPGGYHMAVPNGAVDIQEFDELALAGRHALEEDELPRAADILHRALALARGPAFSDVTCGPVLSVDALHLEERRYEVLEARIDVDLLLGRHHQLVSELSGLAAGNPTREGLHGKLMVALYRAGRRPEALDVFRRLRRALTDELGVEPCQELQALHQQLLAGGAAPDPEGVRGPSVRHQEPPSSSAVTIVPSGVSTVPSVASTVPAAVTTVPSAATAALPPDGTLIGRDRDSALIASMLAENSPLETPRHVAIAGPPGSGVTRLGLRVAHSVAGAYPEGCFYGSFGDPAAQRPLTDVLGDLFASAGFRAGAVPGGAEERIRLLRSWTRGRRVLLVLDDVEYAGQVAGLLPADTGSALLILAHRRLRGLPFAQRVDVEPLDAWSSLELVRHTLGQRGLMDPADLRELLALTGGLPGPLLAAVNLLTLRPHWSVRQLIGWTERHWPNESASRRNQPLHSVLRRVEGLEPQARAVLNQLARLPAEGITVESLGGLLGPSQEETVDMLEGLVECFMLEAEPAISGTTSWFFQYWMPRPVRSALRSRPERKSLMIPSCGGSPRTR